MTLSLYFPFRHLLGLPTIQRHVEPSKTTVISELRDLSRCERENPTPDSRLNTMNYDQRKRAYRKLTRSPLTDEERDWRAFRGESPNPWGKMTSDGAAVMEIVTQRKPSKLERRSEMEA